MPYWGFICITSQPDKALLSQYDHGSFIMHVPACIISLCVSSWPNCDYFSVANNQRLIDITVSHRQWITIHQRRPRTRTRHPKTWWACPMLLPKIRVSWLFLFTSSNPYLPGAPNDRMDHHFAFPSRSLGSEAKLYLNLLGRKDVFSVKRHS